MLVADKPHTELCAVGLRDGDKPRLRLDGMDLYACSSNNRYKQAYMADNFFHSVNPFACKDTENDFAIPREVSVLRFQSSSEILMDRVTEETSFWT